MEVSIVDREITSSGVSQSVQFGISSKDQTHIMTILRDTLYSDKILAVLREYSANAWDAHRMIGKGDVPIKVTLPTETDPVLSIRDFGPGMSIQQVFEVYSQYGASTKRDTNEAVGMMGIGCLLAGQPIVTLKGMTPIEKVTIGDMVLTHKGRFRRVYETMQRYHTGSACRVYLSQVPNPLVLTSEHPILISDSEGHVRWVRPCDIQAGYRSKKKGVRNWNSYAVLPAGMESLESILNIRNLLGPEFDWVEGICTRTTVFRGSRKGIPHKKDSIRKTQYPGLPKQVPLTEELGWLLGLYAAEGSSGSKQVTLSLGLEEEHLASRFQRGMREIFGFQFKESLRPEKNIRELVCHSIPAASLLTSLCGKGSHHKHVPEVIFQGTPEVRCGFLRGVLDGDGSGTRSRFTFGVASPNLAWGVRTLMHITEGKWGTVGHMPQHSRWGVQYNREASWSYSYPQGNYILRPIQKVETFHLDSTVYNFSVEDDESYVSDFVLHNSKSGFAYSDSFTVTSWNGGLKCIYVALLDETDTGTINLLNEEPCGDETGIEIRIPVHIQDINAFRSRAAGLFRFFQPLPDINLEIATGFNNCDAVGEAGFINSSTREWFAIMGCIPYRIDLEQIAENLELMGLHGLKELGGGVFFNIGEVHVNASREELKYTNATKEVLTNKIAEIYTIYCETLFENLRSDLFSPWERRLKANAAQWKFHKDLFPDDLRALLTYSVELRHPDGTGPKTFKLYHPTHQYGAYDASHCVIIQSSARIFIKDDPRALNGFDVSWGFSDLVLRPYKGCTLQDVQTELDKILEHTKLTGIPVFKISDCPWDPQKAAKIKQTNAKHFVNQFKLIGVNSGTLSDNWDAVNRQPEDTDVFVLIKRFEPTTKFGFFADFQNIQELAKALGLEVPTIYGYKTTDKNPIHEKDCVGIPYSKWRENFCAQLRRNKKFCLMAKQYRLNEALQGVENYSIRHTTGWDPVLKKMEEILGADHPIPTSIRSGIAARDQIAKMDPEVKRVLYKLAELTDTKIVSFACAGDGYPLLKIHGVNSLWGHAAEDWLHYVRLMDQDRAHRLDGGESK